MNTEKNAYPHWIKDAVRYRDLDPNNHANNSVFATFFESGRVALLRKIGPFYEDGLETALVHLSVDFMKELKLGSHIDIGTKLNKIGNSSLEIFSAVFEGDDCCATSRAVIVLFDQQSRRAIPIPDDMREKLNGLL